MWYGKRATTSEVVFVLLDVVKGHSVSDSVSDCCMMMFEYVKVGTSRTH